MIGQAVHVDPRVSVPLAVVAAMLLAAQWTRLGRPDVPSPRRRVRRASVITLVIALVSFVRGLSYVDPEVDRIGYVVTWSATLVLMLVIMVVAAIDVIVTLRWERQRARRQLAEALRGEEPRPPGPDEGAGP